MSTEKQIFNAAFGAVILYILFQGCDAFINYESPYLKKGNENSASQKRGHQYVTPQQRIIKQIDSKQRH